MTHRSRLLAATVLIAAIASAQAQSVLRVRPFGDLKGIDPITNSNSTWKPVIETVVVSPGQTDRGIMDVHSASTAVSSIGTAYYVW